MNIRAKIFGDGQAESVNPVLGTKQPKGIKADELVRREEHRRANTRGGDRHRLPDRQAQVEHNGKLHDVQLINVSGGGAMVSGGLAPLLWDRVHLHLGEGGSIEAAVRWLKDDRIGLEFAHETQLDCSPDEQAKLLRTVLAANFGEQDFVPVAPAPRADDRSEGRAAPRHPLIWSGVLHYDFHSAPVRLRNISATGAQIEFEVPLPVGAEPLLDLGPAGQIFATVAWAVGDHAGLRFHKPFDMSLLAKSRPAVVRGDWQMPDYLQSEPNTDPAWADHWGRSSLADLRDELEGFMKR